MGLSSRQQHESATPQPPPEASSCKDEHQCEERGEEKGSLCRNSTQHPLHAGGWEGSFPLFFLPYNLPAGLEKAELLLLSPRLVRFQGERGG